MKRGLYMSMLVAVGIVAWRDLHKEKTLPPPSDFAAVAVIWAFLTLVAEVDSLTMAAAALGWMFDLAIFLNLWDPTNPILSGSQLQTLYRPPAGPAPRQPTPPGAGNKAQTTSAPAPVLA